MVLVRAVRMFSQTYRVRLAVVVGAGFLVAPSLWGVPPTPHLSKQVSAWQPIAISSSSDLGVFSCSATACHGGDRPLTGDKIRVGGEIDVWRSEDPHARAAATVRAAPFRQILERLAIVDQSGATDRKRLNECMNCHNPVGIAMPPYTAEELPAGPETTATFNASERGDGFAINCESCHGNATAWIDNHSNARWNRLQSGLEGFHDLKQLVVRGRVCASCHVGDEKHDMNHDMIAAGHPPLMFELAAYSQRLPKHWRDRRERTLVSHFELRLWLAGQIANYDSALALRESRLKRSAEVEASRPRAPWPEFAEVNCFQCHQTLASDSVASISAPGMLEPGWATGLIAEKGHDWNSASVPTNRRVDRENLQRRFPEAFRFIGPMSDLHLARNVLGEDLSLRSLTTLEKRIQAYNFLMALTQSTIDSARNHYASPDVNPDVLAHLRRAKVNLAYELPDWRRLDSARNANPARTNDQSSSGEGRQAQAVEALSKAAQGVFQRKDAK